LRRAGRADGLGDVEIEVTNAAGNGGSATFSWLPNTPAAIEVIGVPLAGFELGWRFGAHPDQTAVVLSNLTGELQSFRGLFDILATPDIVAVVPLDVLGLGEAFTPLPASAAGQTVRGQVVIVDNGVVEVTEATGTFILF
jgi:hypothetical protein